MTHSTIPAQAMPTTTVEPTTHDQHSQKASRDLQPQTKDSFAEE